MVSLPNTPIFSMPTPHPSSILRAATRPQFCGRRHALTFEPGHPPRILGAATAYILRALTSPIFGALTARVFGALSILWKPSSLPG